MRGHILGFSFLKNVQEVVEVLRHQCSDVLIHFRRCGMQGSVGSSQPRSRVDISHRDREDLQSSPDVVEQSGAPNEGHPIWPWFLRYKVQAFDPRGPSISVVVAAAPLQVKGNPVLRIPDGYV